MKLSIVVASRNDDHGEQLVARTQAFIDFLWFQMLWHSIEAELILIEWNTEEGRPALHTLLAWPPRSAFWSALVLVVPPDIHSDLVDEKHLNFLQFWAKNVGIRHARYNWVLCTNPDVIFTNELCQALTQTKNDQHTIFGTHRKDMNKNIEDLCKGVTGEAMGEFLELCKSNVIRVNSGTTNGVMTDGCGDFMMMSKVGWNKIRGYPELPIWSIHMDSLALMQVIYLHGWQQQLLPGGVYHIDHKASWVDDMGWGKSLPQFTYREVVGLFNEMRDSGKPAYYNSEYWGLADRCVIRITK